MPCKKGSFKYQMHKFKVNILQKRLTGLPAASTRRFRRFFNL
jgi:hypothetical protein